MSQHFIHKCSCGAIIAQCRCPDQNKAVTVIQNGCEVCKVKQWQRVVDPEAAREQEQG